MTIIKVYCYKDEIRRWFYTAFGPEMAFDHNDEVGVVDGTPESVVKEDLQKRFPQAVVKSVGDLVSAK